MEEIIKKNLRRVRDVFKALRNDGLICKTNYMCCNTCAQHGIQLLMKEDNQCIGGVFWHEQDHDSLDSNGGLYIGYFGIKSHHKIGKMVFEAMKNKGLSVTWDGRSSSKVFVDLKQVIH